MAVTTFATVDIGPYDVNLEIFEISAKDGIHSIDRIRHRLELGRETFSEERRISPGMIDDLCEILRDFKRIMHEYKVDAYQAIATTAIREAKNELFILKKIKQTSGFDVRVLSNSEERFLSYKAIASIESNFEDMIKKGTAIIDVGGGSSQISVFDHSQLICSQNLQMGSMRIRERLAEMETESINYEDYVDELIEYNLKSFKEMYLQGHKIENVVFSGGGFLAHMLFRDPKHKNRSTRMLTREEFSKWYRKIERKSLQDIAIQNGITMEYASLVRPTAIIFDRIVKLLDPSMIWAPGTHMSRGLAYEYAERQGILKAKHDFDSDIVSCARSIARRYCVSVAHIENMEMTALAMFDAMKPLHGLGDRERLMLQVAVTLHDAGKYISYNDVGDSTYNIIMTNEIIGLTHTEREMIALAGRYMTEEFDEFQDIAEWSSINKREYVAVAGFTAIMRLANALDRSHLQKISRISCELKKKKFVINIDVTKDYALESHLISEECDFFDEVFGVRPVIRPRRVL
ncbi:MAG: exopolyphosphatase [Eubacteriales bacterium]|jgi:exopolyphosphatase/guanosine-5'-triphosphate,3'-diphosphate pyrophosphatase